MKTKAPKPEPEAPAAPASPPPVAPDNSGRPYNFGNSGLALACRAWASMPDESRKFFDELLLKYEEGGRTLAEVAFTLGASASGYHFISVDFEDGGELREDLDTFFGLSRKTLFLSGGR